MDAGTAGVTGKRPFEVTNRMVFSIAAPMTLAFMTTPLLGLVDTGVVGQFGDARLIGGLAVGAAIFDVIFATFNFQRTSTTGLVAQAVGGGDEREAQAVFWRALVIGLFAGVALAALSPLIIRAGLAFMAPGAGVADATRLYLGIRIVSAPFALANYAILGFVLGRGKSLTGLLLQVFLNGVNVVAAVGLGLGLGWGIAGVACGTVIAETGACAIGLAIVLPGFAPAHRPALRHIFETESLLRLFSVNGDIMIRSFALLAAFAFFTRQGAHFGTVTLAANAVLMNFFLISGYFLDGLATAAEQIVGRAVGARHRPAFDRGVRLTVLWGFLLAGLCTVFLLAAGNGIVAILSRDTAVQAEAARYLPWAAATALTGVLAFEMDGVFIGATWSRDMRNMMLLSLAAYLAALFAFGPAIGNSGLWLALNLFLGLRGITLGLALPRRARQIFG
jgi:multidrug resistance protein, MATE family